MSVCLSTHYGLDGPGIESRWGEIFAPVQTGPIADQASYTKDTGFFPEVKRPGRGVDHPPTSRGEVKETAELHISSHSGPP